MKFKRLYPPEIRKNGPFLFFLNVRSPCVDELELHILFHINPIKQNRENQRFLENKAESIPKILCPLHVPHMPVK